MSANKPIDEPTGTETTGHVWDGIRELDTPLPRWWLWIFYATIIWAIGYVIAFPALPLINSGTTGVLGYSSRAELESEVAMVEESRSALDARLAELSFDDIAADAALTDYARRSGESTFKIVCVQCHGSGAAGSQEYGYPNLNDDAWLWGGTKDDIFFTITHGVRNETDPDARLSLMPAFGDMGMLSRAEISNVADYVLSLSGAKHDAEAAAAGAPLFEAQCAACHGASGEGMTALGAPRLNDQIWLYGGGHDAIVAQITHPRMGVMPAWGERFSDADRKKLTIYVHDLGGGQ